jgi:Tfp pilus assembly protein PilF
MFLLFCAGVGVAFLTLQSGPDLARASRFVDTGDLELARKELDRILASDSDHSAALLMKGDLLQSQGDLAGAVGCYSRIASEAAEFRQASLGHVQALLGMFDLAGAELQMQRHLEIFPSERAIWDELRWLCFNQFRTRDVEELSHWWLKNYSKDTPALTHLLLGVFRPQVPQEGTPYLQQVQKSAGPQVLVWRALAWAAWQSGNQDEAKRLLEQAWQTGSEDPRVRLLSAEILIEEQNVAAAERVLGTEPFGVSGKMFGDQTDRWHWLRSRVLLEQGDVAASLEEVLRAVAIDRGNLMYIHGHAVLLKQLGADVEAAEIFNTARTIEGCKKRLAEIAFSGEWEAPTPVLRKEIADLYQRSGEDLLARLWRQ